MVVNKMKDNDVTEKIKRWSELRDLKAISEKEYQEKKKELLSADKSTINLNEGKDPWSTRKENVTETITKNCDACGNIVSLLAEKCPHCGAPVHKSDFIAKKISSAAYSIFGLFCLIFLLRMCS